MKTLMLALLALAFPLGQACAGEPGRLPMEEPVLLMHADGRVEIDPSGAVAAFTPASPVGGVLEGRLDGMVKALRFEPVVVDGRPARVATGMRLTLAARETAQGTMRITIDNVSFPPELTPDGALPTDAEEAVVITLRSARHPPYPRRAEKQGLQASVLLSVRLHPDGTIADAAVRQSAIVGSSIGGREAARHLAEFERLSLKAMREWRFDVRIAAGASPAQDDLGGLVVMNYRLHGSEPGLDTAGVWVPHTRTAKRDAPWRRITPGELQPGVADVAAGAGIQRATSRFRLATPLEGASL